MSQTNNEEYALSAEKLAAAISLFAQGVQVSDEFYANLENLTKTISHLTATYTKAFDVAAPALFAMAKEVAPLVSDWSKIAPHYSELFTAVHSAAITPIIPFVAEPSPVVRDALAAAEKAIPYVVSDIDEPSIAALSEGKKAKRSWWTYERIVVLLNLLITLFFGILSSLPSKQLEEIIEQDQTIIENQKDQLAEAEKSNQELREILQNLSDSIVGLNDELDALRERDDAVGDAGERADDLSDGEAQPDAADREDQVAKSEQ